MKHLHLVLTITLITAGIFNSTIYAGSSTTENSENKKTTYNIDKLNATVNNGEIYFNITMNVETEKCMYSLVRFNSDGTMKSVGIKNGFVNLNKLPLRYSFKDAETPTEDVKYALYRIGSESSLIAEWQYTSETNTMKLTSTDDSISENFLLNKSEKSAVIID
jgi:hypothetical protein